MPETYSRPTKASTMENFKTVVSDFYSLSIAAKSSILDVCRHPSYASEYLSEEFCFD